MATPKKEEGKKKLIQGNEDEIENIKQQIKQLSLRKKELYKETKEGKDRKEGPPKVKVISNVQLLPPRKADLPRKDDMEKSANKMKEKGKSAMSDAISEGWTTVNRREKRKQKRGQETDKTQKRDTIPPSKGGAKISDAKIRLRKLPKTAAVALRGRNENASYADILRKARSEVSLSEIGVENTRIKKGIDGAVIIEIPGPDGQNRADLLASKLREVLKNDDVNITRPSIKAEIRVFGFDDSVTTEEICNTIAEKTNCTVG